MRSIPESDWKHFRQVQQSSLERFCQRVMSEIGDHISPHDSDPHQRYLAICELVRRSNREMAEAFNDVRRSTALIQLTRIHSLGLLTDQEFAQFSDATRDAVQAIASVRSA